eukprot:TRINITY_DN6134_c0_g1_i1.p2 TRINITY_DN6134_c0_g1~~TRINITY_DN6134_c0_g1_i1.p2  ORF type:complete len:54 (-),score=9.32 TRINITY_DN6134_c0_g1_i1:140-301(-)
MRTNGEPQGQDENEDEVLGEKPVQHCEITDLWELICNQKLESNTRQHHGQRDA